MGQDSLLSTSYASTTLEATGGLRPPSQQQPSFLKSPAHHSDSTTPLKTLLEEELQRGATSINLSDRRLTKLPEEVCSIETLER
jgi:hypothetical protein